VLPNGSFIEDGLSKIPTLVSNLSEASLESGDTIGTDYSLLKAQFGLKTISDKNLDEI